MNPETFLFTLVIGGTLVTTMVLYARYNARELEHKEKLAALEKGADLPVVHSAPWSPRTYLLRGMIWLFVGLTSLFALFAIVVTSNQQPSVEQKLRAVSRARANGATPEEVQMLLADPHGVEPLPIGIGFLGLVPIGVGLAYLIFYRVESKKLLS